MEWRRAEIGRSRPIRCDGKGNSARLDGPDPENGAERD
jgi:hypothetical protein